MTDYLGFSSCKLNEANALELSRLTVCGQAHGADSTALSKGLCQLLANGFFAKVLVKALDKDGCAVAVRELACKQKEARQCTTP